MQELFGLNIYKVISSHQIYDGFDENEIVISTINLGDIGVDYIVVSPIITHNDYVAISTYLDSVSLRYLVRGNSISSNQSLYTNEYKESIGKTKKGLKDFLDISHIQIKAKISSRREAIVIASKPLLDDNLITDEYIDFMIRNVEDYGPYVVLNDIFALPHANMPEGIKNTSFSFLKLENPLKFGDIDNKFVKYVSVIAVSDLKDHEWALFELTNLFASKAIINKLDRARNPLEIYEILVGF